MKRSKPSSTRYQAVFKLADKRWFVFFVFAFLSLLLYGSSLSSWGAADDLNHIRAALEYASPLKDFFRPIEWSVNRLDIAWLGYQNLALSRWFNLLGFWITIASLYTLGRIIWPSSAIPSLFAAMLLVVSSQSTLAVIQIDTISQQYATVFALLFLLSLLVASQRKSPGLRLVAYVFAFLALLSKETAPGLVAAVPLAVALIGWDKNVYTSTTQAFRVLFTNYLGVAFTALLYASLRLAFGYGFSDTDSAVYDLVLSVGRVSKNLMFYAADLFYSGGSTLDIFPQLKLWRVGISSAFSIVLLAAVLITIIRAVLKKSVAALSLLALSLLIFAGSFPAVLTRQVSELYIYSSLPFFALLLGISFHQSILLLADRIGTKRTYYAAVIFSLCLFSWVTFYTHEKIALITQLNNQSLQYFTQAQGFFSEATDEVVLCWPESQKAFPSYSTIIMTPHHVANRAIDLAAFVDDKKFYLLSGSNLIRASEGLQTINSETQLPKCGYQLELTGDKLRFLK